MKCPECGAENPDDSTFCNLCHRRINYLEHRSDPFYPSVYGPGDARTYSTGWRSAISGRARFKQFLVTVLILLAITAVVIGAAYLAQRFTAGEATYSDNTSNISFEYPRRWFELSSEEALELLGFDYSVNSEVSFKVFTDRKDKNPETVLFLGTKGGYVSPDDDLRLVLKNFRFEFLQQLINGSIYGIYPGHVLANLTYSDVTVYGTYPGILVKGNLWEGETIARTCEILITTNGRMVFFLALISHTDSGSDTTFQEIIDSIKFETDENAPTVIK